MEKTQTYHTSNDVVEIRIMDLLFYCLSKWKQLLAAALVMALLMGGYAVYKNGRITAEENEVIEEEGKTETETEGIPVADMDEEELRSYVADFEEDLTAATRDELNNAVLQITQNQEFINEWTKYLNTSLKMQTDSTEEYTSSVRASLEYIGEDISILTRYYNLGEWMDCLKDYLVSDDNLEPLADEMGTTSAYLKEQISISTSTGTLMYIVEMAAGNAELLEDMDAQLYILVTANAPEAEIAERITAYLTEQIEAAADGRIDEMVDVLFEKGSVAYTKLSDNIAEGTDSNLMTQKFNLINQINSARNYIINMLAKLNDEEQEYVYARLALDQVTLSLDEVEATEDLEAETETETETETDEEDEEEEASRLVSVPKYVVIGAMMGLVLAFVLYGCIYLFSSKLHSLYTLEDQYGLNVYAMRDEEHRIKDPVERRIQEVRYRTVHFCREEQLAAILSAQYAQMKEAGAALVLTTSSNLMKTSAFETFCNAMKKHGWNVSREVGLRYTPEAITELTNASLIILFEKTEVSYKHEIHEELVTLEENGKRIVTAVVMV